MEHLSLNPNFRTLEALWVRCGGSDADTRELERVLRRAGHSSDLVP
jgi:hypothetical protein